MEFKPTYKLESSFFQNVSKGTEFFGKLKGFRATKDYWIGTCLLRDVKKISLNGEVVDGCVDFIICEKIEKSFKDLLNLKLKVGEKDLKLTFKGITVNGFPIFFQEFM